MAGDWIKFELATPDKPEVWAIAASLSIDPDAVVGKLLRVWGWFDQQTENGNAPSVSKMLLDRLVGVSGFCKAVIDADWMHDDGVTLSLPHFDRHNGKTAKNRATTAKRVASFKNKAVKSNAPANDEVTQAPLPKEEKRREEKIDKELKDPAPQADADLIAGLDESTTDKQKKEVAPKFKPEWLAEQMPEPLGEWWIKWIDYRRARKLSTKELTWRAQAANLAEWGKAGHDPCLAIKASIENGWSGLFEPKKQGAVTQYKTAAEKEAERNAYTFDLERARIF